MNSTFPDPHITYYTSRPLYLLRVMPTWIKWHMQGKPRDMPVVAKPGTIRVCPHGFALVSNWSLSHTFQKQSIDINHLVDILTARYPVQRVQHLDCCDKGCNE